MRPTGYFPRAKKRLRANGQMLLMCALPLLKIFVFSYLPMIGIVLAFKMCIRDRFTTAPADGILKLHRTFIKRSDFP